MRQKTIYPRSVSGTLRIPFFVIKKRVYIKVTDRFMDSKENTGFYSQ